MSLSLSFSLSLMRRVGYRVEESRVLNIYKYYLQIELKINHIGWWYLYVGTYIDRYCIYVLTVLHLHFMQAVHTWAVSMSK